MILVQEPYVSGKGVISKGLYCLGAIAIKAPQLPIRASIFFHKSMERQIWPKDSMTTEDCAVAHTKINGIDMPAVSSCMDGCEEQCPSQAFKDSVEHAKKHNLVLIIGTDANALTWHGIAESVIKITKSAGINSKSISWLITCSLRILVTLPLLIMGGRKIRLILKSRISLATIL